MGVCSYGEAAKPLFNIVNKNGEAASYSDGAINESGNVMGTYIHGVLDGIQFREYVVNRLRRKKALPLKVSNPYESLREKELDKLADIVRESLDMKAIYEFMGVKR